MPWARVVRVVVPGAGPGAARPVRAGRVDLGDDRGAAGRGSSPRPSCPRPARAPSPSRGSPTGSRCCRSTGPGSGAASAARRSRAPRPRPRRAAAAPRGRRRRRRGSPARPAGPARRRRRRSPRSRRGRRPRPGPGSRRPRRPGRSRARYRPRVIRLGKTSSGIQLTPRTKTGVPLTTSVNAVPSSSAAVSRRDGAEADPAAAIESSGRRRSVQQVTRSAYSGWSP